MKCSECIFHQPLENHEYLVCTMTIPYKTIMKSSHKACERFIKKECGTCVHNNDDYDEESEYCSMCCKGYENNWGTNSELFYNK